MKKIACFAVFILLSLIFVTGLHHHNDLLIHDDCAICAVIHVSADLPIAAPIILSFFLLFIILQKVDIYFVRTSLSYNIRAPPLS